MLGPFVPWFERHEKEGVVRGADCAEQAEPDDRRGISYTRRISQDGLDLFADLVRALKRRGVRQLDVQKHISLIFNRDETTGQLRSEPARHDGDRG